MESLVTLKQALDAGLIDADDYQRGKEAFLRAQQVCSFNQTPRSLSSPSCADTQRLRQRAALEGRLRLGASHRPLHFRCSRPRGHALAAPLAAALPPCSQAARVCANATIAATAATPPRLSALALISHTRRVAGSPQLPQLAVPREWSAAHARASADVVRLCDSRTAAGNSTHPHAARSAASAAAAAAAAASSSANVHAGSAAAEDRQRRGLCGRGCCERRERGSLPAWGAQLRSPALSSRPAAAERRLSLSVVPRNRCRASR